MSFIPAFELGLWNAWIFMVPSLLITLVALHLLRGKGAPGGGEGPPLSKPTLLFFIISKLIYFAAVVYSVFLPLRLGTIWFYVGLPITLIGLVGFIVVLVDWANTPAGKPITRGFYRYSRHPMYVTSFLLLLGVSIASASWVFLLFPIIEAAGAIYFAKMEETSTLEHYGTAYQEYMNRTPRWIGMPKSEKKEKA